MKKKLLTAALCTIIAVMAIAGASLAYLQDSTETVINTFTKGEVDIDLYETKDGSQVMSNSYKMVPGDELTKDPTVTVKAVSEKCYVFVKVEKTDNFDTFLSYEIADGWTELTEGSGVYYRVAEDKDTDQTFTVLADNKVTVNTTVTTDNMNSLTGSNNPQLKFTAYAVQFENVADAATAWGLFSTNP